MFIKTKLALSFFKGRKFNFFILNDLFLFPLRVVEKSSQLIVYPLNAHKDQEWTRPKPGVQDLALVSWKSDITSACQAEHSRRLGSGAELGVEARHSDMEWHLNYQVQVWVTTKSWKSLGIRYYFSFGKYCMLSVDSTLATTHRLLWWKLNHII